MNIFSLKNKVIIIVILVMIFYAGLAIYSDINKISENFRKIRIEGIGIIFILEVMSFAMKSLRQKKFLNSIGIKLSFITNFKIYSAGMSMLITPGGAGMLIKSHFLKRNYGQPISKTFPLVFVERFHDFLAITTIVTFTLLLSHMWQSIFVVIIASILLLTIFFIFRRTSHLIGLQKKLWRIKYINKIIPKDFQHNETLNSLTGTKITITCWIISIIAFLFDSLAVYVGFLSFNQDLGVVKILQTFNTSVLFGTLSFLPGGVGFTEGSFIGLLLSQNLQLSTASALVLFVRLTTLWFATVFGFIATKFVLKDRSMNEKKL